MQEYFRNYLRVTYEDHQVNSGLGSGQEVGMRLPVPFREMPYY